MSDESWMDETNEKTEAKLRELGQIEAEASSSDRMEQEKNLVDGIYYKLLEPMMVFASENSEVADGPDLVHEATLDQRWCTSRLNLGHAKFRRRGSLEIEVAIENPKKVKLTYYDRIDHLPLVVESTEFDRNDQDGIKNGIKDAIKRSIDQFVDKQ